MNRIRLCKAAIATAIVASAALLSFGWSEQSGMSLSVESAQARVGRPLTPVSVAGVARRQNRRAAYQYAGSPNNIPGLVGGDDAGTYSPAPYYGGSALGAAAAVGTAAAVAATQPWGWGGGPYVGSGYYGGAGTGYYGGSALNAQAAYYGGGRSCTLGTLYIAADGLVQMCKKICASKIAAVREEAAQGRLFSRASASGYG